MKYDRTAVADKPAPGIELEHYIQTLLTDVRMYTKGMTNGKTNITTRAEEIARGEKADSYVDMDVLREILAKGKSDAERATILLLDCSEVITRIDGEYPTSSKFQDYRDQLTESMQELDIAIDSILDLELPDIPKEQNKGK